MYTEARKLNDWTIYQYSFLSFCVNELSFNKNPYAKYWARQKIKELLTQPVYRHNYLQTEPCITCIFVILSVSVASDDFFGTPIFYF